MRLEETLAAVRLVPIRATARQGETPATEECHRHRQQATEEYHRHHHLHHLWVSLIDPELTWRGETSATEA